MTGRPSISIAMCTYNGARYLEEQLNSIAVQTFAPRELVICDDCSGDGTTEIIEAFLDRATFPVRLHVNEKNLGSTKNFERAIGNCTGDIIALADQDDVWLPTKLERMAEVFSGRPRVGVVFTEAELVDSELRPLRTRLWSSVGFSQAQQMHLRNGRAAHVMLKHNVATGAAMALRTVYRNLVLPIPRVWSHDAWIALLVAFVSEVEIIRDPLFLYRQHSENQIGAIRSRRKARRSATGYFSDRCLHRVIKYRCVKERVVNSRECDDVREQIVERIDAKIRHLQARHEISRAGWRRLPMATREFVTLGYHQFSKRDRAFLADLLRIGERAPI